VTKPVYIDPRIHHVGFTKLRVMGARGAKKLKDNEIMVVHAVNATPLLVVIPYKLYLNIQDLLQQQEPPQ